MQAILYLLAAAAACAVLGWYMIVVPGESFRGGFAPLEAKEIALRTALKRHVETIASTEHNAVTPALYEQAAAYIEQSLTRAGYSVRSQSFSWGGGVARNLEVVIAGAKRDAIVIGAHYDSMDGSPGANDNGSGVAAALELALAFRGWRPKHSIRIAFFANEEPPYFHSEAMGSKVYADELAAAGEPVRAMFSLETIGYYSDKPGSQRYPFPLGLFYPDRGDFLAFVANLASRPLLHAAIAAFREQARFPSEGVAAPAFIPGVDWSDHWSFWQQGYPAIMVTDTALYRYPWYHSVQDTPDKIDYERLARAVTGLGGMLEELAAR